VKFAKTPKRLGMETIMYLPKPLVPRARPNSASMRDNWLYLPFPVKRHSLRPYLSLPPPLNRRHVTAVTCPELLLIPRHENNRHIPYSPQLLHHAILISLYSPPGRCLRRPSPRVQLRTTRPHEGLQHRQSSHLHSLRHPIRHLRTQCPKALSNL
jgi:hypothetical protein